jgi:hypothetical protein
MSNELSPELSRSNLVDKEFIESTNKHLEDLKKRIQSSDDYIALCLIFGSALGNSVVTEIIQTKIGCFLTTIKYPAGETVYNKKIDIDLVQGLANLKKEYSELRTMLSEDNTRGRYKTFIIATKDDGEWIACQSPLNNNFSDNTLDKILKAVSSIVNSKEK